MRWVHAYLRETLSNLVYQFEDEGAPIEFSFTAFRDHRHAPSTWIEHLGFTGEEQVAKARNWLAELKATGGGGNAGESSMAGMLYAIRNSEWPEANRRVVVIFTDDNPHVPDFGVKDWAEVHSTLRDENVEQVHLFTDQKHEPGYDELDDLGYLVVRHPLVRDDAEALEESIREFIRISSEGGGEFTPLVRDESVNPFDSEATPMDVGEDDVDVDENPFDLG